MAVIPDTKIRIVNEPTGSTVEINGHAIEAVRCITVRHEAGSLPQITLEVLGSLDLDGA